MKGETGLNPLLGSEIVKNNRIKGIGAHLNVREPHAVIHVLRLLNYPTQIKMVKEFK